VGRDVAHDTQAAPKRLGLPPGYREPTPEEWDLIEAHLEQKALRERRANPPLSPGLIEDLRYAAGADLSELIEDEG
jgi:hypothetical protein